MFLKCENVSAKEEAPGNKVHTQKKTKKTPIHFCLMMKLVKVCGHSTSMSIFIIFLFNEIEFNT